jgi:hypothetical protein
MNECPHRAAPLRIDPATTAAADRVRCAVRARITQNATADRAWYCTPAASSAVAAENQRKLQLKEEQENAEMEAQLKSGIEHTTDL